jgi:hypothetical protein
MMRHTRLREAAGVLRFDLRRYLWAAFSRSNAWLRLCNRAETLTPAPAGPGFACNWRWTSELHAPLVFPFLGRLLLRRALRDLPFVLDYREPVGSAAAPDVSVVIGHRGADRLPLLRMTLRSLASQTGVRAEYIVVEHAERPEAEALLPHWVRYRHVLAHPAEPFNRAKAFNAGVATARGPWLILHDGDLLTPAAYAQAALDLFGQGFEVINLKRYLFYLGDKQTNALLEASGLGAPTACGSRAQRDSWSRDAHVPANRHEGLPAALREALLAGVPTPADERALNRLFHKCGDVLARLGEPPSPQPACAKQSAAGRRLWRPGTPRPTTEALVGRSLRLSRAKGTTQYPRTGVDWLLHASAPERILQNATGGGSLCISRAAYDAIGGFDEGFVGWGGEDVDFWDRAQTRRVWPYAHLPFIHLWHAPQPNKTPAKDSLAMHRLAEVSQLPVAERIARLRACARRG